MTMKNPARVLFALITGLLMSVVAQARPISLSAQDTKATPSNQGTTGQSSTGQKGGAPAQAPSGPTAEERQAFAAVQSESSAGLDPERVITLAQDFEKKFPSSPFLSYAYFFEANAYESKGDYDKLIDAGEKSIKLNADNLMTLIMMSTVLPQPQAMKGSNDLDKQKKLTEAEADANHALELIAKLPKQPTEADDAFKKRIDTVASEPHAALGMIHLQRASMTSLTGGMDPDELAKAAVEYKQSVEMTPQPLPQNYYRLGEVYMHENKLADAIAAFSKASELGQGSPIQAYADKQIEALKKLQTPAKP
jgi:tetratricopeptide (TPR) repeat protein